MESLGKYTINSDFIDLLSLAAVGWGDPDIKINFNSKYEYVVISNILKQVELINAETIIKIKGHSDKTITLEFQDNKFQVVIIPTTLDSSSISVAKFIANYCYDKLGKKNNNLPNGRNVSCYQPTIDNTKYPPLRVRGENVSTSPDKLLTGKCLKVKNDISKGVGGYAYFNIKARSIYSKGAIKTIVIKGDNMLSALTRYYNNLDILKVRDEPISCVLAKNVFDDLK